MTFKINGYTKIAATAGLLSASIILAACSGEATPGQVKACENGISQGYAEITQAKADGFGGAAALTKAGSLLSAAKIQQQFEKYPNCIDKVKRARYYIRQARSGGS